MLCSSCGDDVTGHLLAGQKGSVLEAVEGDWQRLWIGKGIWRESLWNVMLSDWVWLSLSCLSDRSNICVCMCVCMCVFVCVYLTKHVLPSLAKEKSQSKSYPRESLGWSCGSAEEPLQQVGGLDLQDKGTLEECRACPEEASGVMECSSLLSHQKFIIQKQIM